MKKLVGLLCLVFSFTIIQAQIIDMPFAGNQSIPDQSNGGPWPAESVPYYNQSFRFFRYTDATTNVANARFKDLRFQNESSQGGCSYWDLNEKYSHTGSRNNFIIYPTDYSEGYTQSYNINLTHSVKHCNHSSLTQNLYISTFSFKIYQPEWLSTTSEIRRVCQDGLPITLQDYFKPGYTPVFTVNGSQMSTFNPSSMGVGTYTVTATLVYDNGTYTENITIEVLPKPVVTITPSGSTNICEGTSVTLSAPLAPAGQTYTYTWSNGETSQQINVSNSGNYTVTVSNGGCSTTSPSLAITTKPAPSDNISVTGDYDICDGASTVLTAANAASYQWFKNGSPISGEVNQSLVVSAAGSYNAVLTGANSCTTTTGQIVITVKPNPKPTIVVTGNTTFCAGQSVTLTAQSTGIPSNYSWSNGMSGPTVNITTSGVYTVTATNPGSCQAVSLPIAITVLPNPKPTITPDRPLSFCPGGGVNLKASPGVSYLWSNGSTSQEIFTNISGVHRVTVTGSNGCPNTSDPISVTLKAKPNAGISANRSLALCSGESVILTASGGDSYLWYPNGENSESITVSAAGTYYVTVFKDGCQENSIIKTVTVNTPVTPVIQVLGSQTPCYGEIITLTAPDAVSYLWSNGLSSKSIDVTQTGSFTVITKDINGCSATSASISINYKSQFSPIITAGGNTTICNGNSVSLTATSGIAYLWNTGATTQSINATTGGNYTCIVTNAQSCSVETPPISVIVNQRPTPIISANGPTTFCSSGSVILTVSNPESGASYTWSNGATGQSTTITQNSSVTVNATYSNGCSAISTPTTITVLPIIQPTVNASGPLRFCEGGSVTLNINEVGDSYTWNDGVIGKARTITTSGTYIATISNTNGCSLSSIPLTVVVDSRPTPVVSPNGPTTFCQGGNVILVVSNPVSGASYNWSNGTTGQSTTITQNSSVTVNATYANGCSAISSPTTVTVFPILHPTISASGALTFCEGGSVVLSVNEIGDSYTWSDGVVGKNRTIVTSGTYSATIANTNGCSSTSDPITVVVNPKPVPIISANGPTTFCQEGSVVLSVSNPISGASYNWSNGTVGQSTTVTQSSSITVNASYSNGCSAISTPTTVTVLPILRPTINASGALTFCEGGSVVLTINEVGDNYTWSDGVTGKTRTITSSGTYSATITNTNGCSLSSSPVTVTVSPKPKPIINVTGNTSFCAGQSVTLSIANPVSNASYIWSNGVNGNSIVVHDAGNYFVSVNYLNGCSEISAPVEIKVFSITKPTITASGNTTFCEGNSISLTVNEIGDTYVWNDGVTGKTRTVSTTGVYIATISNGSGCSLSSDPITVTVSATPKPLISLSQPSPICEGQSTTAYITNPQTGANYTWSNGVSGTTAIFTQSGNYTVYATYANGCTTVSDPINLVVKALPKPTLSGNTNSTICEGQTITLTINETAAAYRWSTGETTKSIVKAVGGTFTGYISNNDGCERSSDPIIVTVKDNKIASISIFGKTEICEGEKTILTASQGASWRWSNGATTRSIEVTSTSTNSVEITNASGCVSTSGDVFIKVNPIPKPTVQINGSLNFCEGQETILTINEVGSQYRWSNGETTKSITVKTSQTISAFISNAQGCERESDPITVVVKPNPKLVITSSGNTTFCEGGSINLSVPLIAGFQYTWSNGQTGNTINCSSSGSYFVTVTNANGCSNITDPITVVVNPIPKPTIQLIGTTDFCEPASVTLTIKENGAGYRWSNGETTKSITLTTSQTVTAFIQNAQGCERESDPIIITVKANVLPVITASGSTKICEGQNVTLSVPNQAGYTYKWSNGDETNRTIITTSGDYYVTVTSPNGCSRGSEITKVTVNPIPKPTIQVIGTTDFCEPASVTLTIKENGAGYRWSNGETTKSITLTTSQTVTAFIQNDQGCERESDPITITVKANVLPVITASGSTTICEGQSVTLSVPNIVGYTYSWSNGTTANSTVITTSGDYYVTVTSPNGCARSSEITKVTVYPIPKPTIINTGTLTFCEGESITLTIKEDGAGYRWNNAAKTKSITVNGSGTYIGYIQNSEGCERASEAVSTVMLANPIPIITASGKTRICYGETVTLTSSPGVSYLWSDGSTTRTIVVDKPGDYFVTVTNTLGCSRTSPETKIVVLANDTPTIQSILGNEFCSGGITKLTASEGSFYRWSTGETTREISVDKSGSYFVVVINENNCSRQSVPFVITVRQPTILSKIIDFETCINGGNINLDSKNSSNQLGGTYSGTGVVGNIFNPVTAGLGTFKIEYLDLNQYGCSSKTDFTITVVDLTPLKIDADIAVCETSANILLLNSSLPVGVVASGTGVTNNIFKPAEAGLGKHIILYSYTNGFGCKSTATRVIEVVATPSLPVVTGGLQGCDGEVLTITAKATVIGGGNLTYLWYKKGEALPFFSGQILNYTLNGSEIIYVSAKVSNAASCESSLTEISLISNNPLGDFSSNATIIPLAGLVKFTNTVKGATQFLWNFGDGKTSTDANPVHYYYKAGKYTVKMTAYSSQGCPLILEKLNYITVDPDNIIINPPVNESSPINQGIEYTNAIVYPNPITNGAAKVRIYNKESAKEAIVQIYTLGQRLISSNIYELVSGQNDIPLKDIGGLNGGKTYYLFVINVGGKLTTIKVLVL